MRKAGIIGLGIGVVVGAMFLVVGVSYYLAQSEVSPYRSLSESELNALAVNWEYDDMLRNISKYQGKIIRFEGEVLSAEQAGTDHYGLAVNVAFGDTIIVDYTGSRVLMGDKVRVYGEVSHVSNLKSLLADMIFPYPVVKAVRLYCLNC